MDIIDLNGEKLLVIAVINHIADDLIPKRKFDFQCDVVLKKDDTYYFCRHIQDAKFEDIKEENENVIKNESEIALDSSSGQSN